MQLHSNTELESFRYVNKDENGFVCLVIVHMSRRRETRRPLVDNEILRKSCLHEDEIYNCEFFSPNQSKIIEKSLS